MKPEATDIVRSVAAGLRDRVAPSVTDPWGESVLRSVDLLLRHLAVRLEHETDILFADALDMRETLARLATLGLPAPTDLPDSFAPPALRAQHERLSLAFEEAIRRLHEEQPANAAALAEVRAYVARRVTRERPLLDLGTGLPF